jgi:hypothetical protein
VCVLALESPTQCPGHIDRAVTLFPATPKLIGFVAHVVQRAATNAMGTVSAVKVQGHVLAALIVPRALCRHYPKLPKKKRSF